MPGSRPFNWKVPQPFVEFPGFPMKFRLAKADRNGRSRAWL